MSKTNFPTEPGCYVDGTWGHYALAEMAERFGTCEDAAVASAYRKAEGNDQCVIHDTLANICDLIESDWNASLPSGLMVGWADGELFVGTEEFFGGW